MRCFKAEGGREGGREGGECLSTVYVIEKHNPLQSSLKIYIFFVEKKIKFLLFTKL